MCRASRDGPASGSARPRRWARSPARRRAGSSTARAPRPRAGVVARPSASMRQRVEHRRADVAGDGHALAGALDQLAGQRGGRRLAVGAGDREHLAARSRASAASRPARARTGRARPAPACRLRAPPPARPAMRASRGARPGLFSTRVTPSSARRRARRRRSSACGTCSRSAAACGGVRARVPTRTARRARAPARHRQARCAEAQHQHAVVLQSHVIAASGSPGPTRHSSIVMIQKRTTTCVSFQPVFSKWWCSGAILRMRRPSP